MKLPVVMMLTLEAASVTVSSAGFSEGNMWAGGGSLLVPSFLCSWAAVPPPAAPPHLRRHYLLVFDSAECLVWT